MVERNRMLETLADAVKRLNELHIDYMLTGSVAMSAYVTARTTMDIDIVLDIAGVDPRQFERKFVGDYYVDAVSIDRARLSGSTFNVLNLQTGIKVDFIVRKQNLFEAEKFERRSRSSIDGNEFWVITKEDLILSKLQWSKDSHSELQFRDIRNMLESGADEGFLKQMITMLGLNEVWEAFNLWKIRIEK